MQDACNSISLSESEAPYFVGIDLDGTNVKLGLVDNQGRTLAFLKIPTCSEEGSDDTTRRIGEAVIKLIAEAGLESKDIARVGLGSPGTMDIPAGKLLLLSNLKGWDQDPIRDRLSEACGLPVTLANDANAAAFGEYWIGSGKGFKSLILLTLGTGVGCGIIINDLSLIGSNSHNREGGHMIVNASSDARWCNCGQRGHLEAYASATAVVRRTQEMLDAGLQSSLTGRIAAGEELTALMISQEAEKGDTLSLDVVMETARWLGIGIVNLMHTIDPTGVLIGGAMTFGANGSELGRKFLARIKQEVDSRAFALLAERLKLEFASLGSSAGYIGAAGIAREEYLRVS